MSVLRQLHGNFSSQSETRWTHWPPLISLLDYRCLFVDDGAMALARMVGQNVGSEQRRASSELEARLGPPHPLPVWVAWGEGCSAPSEVCWCGVE